ncbi:Altronate oxidoreductase [compost metagenome]
MTLAFAALLLSYRGDRVARQDGAEVLAVFDQAWSSPDSFVQTILKDESLWGQDLTLVPGLTAAVAAKIQELENTDSRAALQQAVN